MSGGFPIKCVFCEVNNLDFLVRGLLTMLIDEYGLFALLPDSNLSSKTSSIFRLQLDEDMIVKSVYMPIATSEITLSILLDQILANECVRFESQILIYGRAFEPQFTFRKQGESISLSIVFTRDEQVMPFLQEMDQFRVLMAFLIDVATATDSAGFLVDYYLPDDPDIEQIEGAAIVNHLVRNAGMTSRVWHARNRPGLIIGARENLVSMYAVKNAWGPSADVFSSRDFVVLGLI
jgi:hypothetical protein